MTISDRYINQCAKQWVWSGYYTLIQVQELLESILEPHADVNSMKTSVEDEFARKREAETTWPEVTDCDRLDQAFDALQQQGIVALQNSGATLADGHYEVGAFLLGRDRSQYKGYCFYHCQDTDRAALGGPLFIAFGDLDNNIDLMSEVGQLVKQELELAGLEVEWSGEPDDRIVLPSIAWKRRSPVS